jgi:sugar O-acyltransferase (sialic acid O-acetyltransferase NeuD family)
MTQIRAIYGAAGCGRGVMPLLRDMAGADTELIFVDDAAAGQMINGHKILGFEAFVQLSASSKAITIAIADSKIRALLAIKCSDHGIGFSSIAAQNHVRMDACEIGEGAIFSPFTTLTSNIQIGRHFHCNIGSYVEHDCVIGDYVTFAPGVKCNGNIHIGDHAYIGSGAIIRQGSPGNPLRIGAGAVVGMGAVVTKDVASGETVIGNPARPMQR